MFCKQCGEENSGDARYCVGCGMSMLISSAPAPAHQTAEALPAVNPNAGFWLRLIAVIIDGVLSQLLLIVVAYPLGFALGVSMAETSTMAEIEAAGEGLGAVLGLLIQWLWFTLFESSTWQATPGKKMLGIKVTDEHGNRIGFGKANARYWSKILSTLILFVGFFMVAFTKKKQGLHDIIAGTLVVNSRA